MLKYLPSRSATAWLRTLRLFGGSLLLLSFYASPARAQGEDIGLLYLPPTLRASLQMTPYQCSGTTLCINEYAQETETVPLPIIFFDGAGSADIPTRYQQFLSTADADQYSPTTQTWEWESRLAKYYQLLNIVGFRMRAHPETTIALEGGYSAEPGESPEIAVNRAVAIRDYLAAIWKIDEARIHLRRPQQNGSVADGWWLHQEARRVVFYTESPEIFSPIRHWRTSRSFQTLSLAIIVDPLMNGEEIAGIDITVHLEDSVFSAQTLDAKPGAQRYLLQTDCVLDPQLLPEDESTISMGATVRKTDSTHRTTNTVSFALQINRREQKLEEKKIDIPFFSYADSLYLLQGFQIHLIDRFMLDNASGKGTVVITGGSDPSESPQTQREWLTSNATNSDQYMQDPWSEQRARLTLIFEKVQDGIAEYRSLVPSSFICGSMDMLNTSSNIAYKRAKSVAAYVTATFASGLPTEIKGNDAVEMAEYRLPEERYYLRVVTMAFNTSDKE